MKLQLMHIENYLVAVDDSEIKEVPCCNLAHRLVVRPTDLELANSNRKNLKVITHHLPLNNAPVLEGVELLPHLEDDVAFFINNRKTFRFKAKEDYKYTQEDMIEFHKWLLKEQWFYHSKHNEFNNPFGEIKSTKELLNLWKEQQPNLPTSFDTETKQYIY